MPLSAGTRLGSYEILAPLGAGGMGEVYRATDTRLRREVAIKTLPTEVATDPERLSRFQREAHLLASLNHPNIASIHGLEEAEGQPFLVLELVEGEDLQERLRRGAIPVDDAVEIASQIAAALEEAHENGIVHRDLKPANVKLTPEGKVKVLDFGLAKAYAAEAMSGSAPDMSQSPTLAHSGTAAGLILGTAAYMSPEQARGKAVDKRADIWAFGVLLWEMLTGRSLFSGETVSDVLAAVLTRTPNWDDLPSPARHLNGVLARCLERDPRKRFRDIGDVRLEIERVQANGSANPDQAVTSRSRPHPLVIGLGLLAAAAAGALLMRFAAPAAPGATTSLRVSMPLAPGQKLVTVDSALLAFSPDGSTVVAPVIDDGQVWLVRRRLDDSSAERIEGTEDGRAPFFSPDGEWLGFRAGGKLMKVPVEGGRPFVLVDHQGFGGAAWGSDGHIVFAPLYSEGLFLVPEEGGEPRRLTAPDREQGELGHWWPHILPDGKNVLFTAFRSPIEDSLIAVASLETGEVRRVLEGGTFGRYVQSGHLLYVKGNRLFAAPFDPAEAVLTGSAKSVLDDVHAPPTEALAMFAVSADGTLAWVPQSLADPPREIVWVDRDGLTEPASLELRRFSGVNLAPDGLRFVTAILGDSLDLWTYSLERRTLSRLTTGARTEFAPFWSRDGESVLFALDRPPYEIHRVGIGASREASALWTAEEDTVVTGLSADGRLIVYTVTEPDTGRNVWVAPIDGGEGRRPFRATRYEEKFGSFSPDGRWLAYESDETGRPEIYVEAHPGPGERFQISPDGGFEPLWAHGSGEIFYRHGDEVRVARTRTGPPFEFEAPQTLFEGAFDRGHMHVRNYDVTPDGKRILAIRVPNARAPRRIDLITNWLEELERLVPK